MRFRPQWFFAIGMLLIASIAAQAQTETYPSRPITVVVPFPAGGLTDVPARLAATMLQEKLGQGVVIENRTGGSGVVGAAYAARAVPDGYTLFANSLADTQNLHYLPVNYNPVEDFAQIGWIVDGPPLVVIANAKLPYKTLKELLADAAANPGKFSFGTSGPASSPGLSLAQLNAMAKTQITAVPYRGSAAAVTDVLSGRVDVMLDTATSGFPRIANGQFRALAVTSPARFPLLPEAPTVAETLPGVHYMSWLGMATAPRTPKPIVERLNAELRAALALPDVQAKLKEGGNIATPTTPEEMRDQIAGEIANWKQLIETNNIKVQ